MTKTVLNRSAYLSLIAFLSALTMLGPMATDLYLPAMPSIARSLNSSMGAIQLTFGSYVFGFALGLLIFGPLSDFLGRRKVILSGLIGFIIISLLTGFSWSIQALMIFRMLQALAAASVMVSVPAIVKDMIATQFIAKALSMILLVMTLGPLIAPIIGGLLIKIWRWPALFYFLAFLGLLLLAWSFLALNYTFPRSQKKFLETFSVSYKNILMDKQIMGYLLSCGMLFAILLALVATLPFVYIHLYQVSPQNFGFLFALNIVSLSLCSFINIHLLNRYSSVTMLWVSVIMGLMAIVIMLAGAYFYKLAIIVVGVMLYFASQAFANPNANALAMNKFPESAGAVSAVLGALQFGLGGIVTTIIGLVQKNTLWPLLTTISISVVLATLCLSILARNGKNTANPH